MGKFARDFTFEIDSLLATIQLAAATLDGEPGLVEALKEFLDGDQTIFIKVVCQFPNQQSFLVLILCLQ